VSQTQVEDTVTQQKVLDDLSVATGVEVKMAELSRMTEIRYQVALAQLLQNLSNMTTRQCVRVVSNAIDLPIQSGMGKPFVKEFEAKTAALMAQVIDLRNILQADIMEKEEQRKINETKAKEGATNESV
jgi:hypothetical protein